MNHFKFLHFFLAMICNKDSGLAATTNWDNNEQLHRIILQVNGRLHQIYLSPLVAHDLGLKTQLDTFDLSKLTANQTVAVFGKYHMATKPFIKDGSRGFDMVMVTSIEFEELTEPDLIPVQIEMAARRGLN